VSRSFDMARKEMPDPVARLESGIKRVDRGARDAESSHHALFLHY
jgi:hypothetical protein